MISLFSPQRLSVWSTNRPRTTIAIVVLITVLFAVWLPKVRTDTDPKNMLPPTSVSMPKVALDAWLDRFV